MSSMGLGLRAVAAQYDFTDILSRTTHCVPVGGSWRTKFAERVRVEGNVERASVLCLSDGKLGLWAFHLDGMPHNCGIVVSGGAWIFDPLRRKGLGQSIRAVKDEICRAAGYTIVQCTTRATNANQIHILEKDGWKRTMEFINKRTGNHCIQWAKEL